VKAEWERVKESSYDENLSLPLPLSMHVLYSFAFNWKPVTFPFYYMSTRTYFPHTFTHHDMNKVYCNSQVFKCSPKFPLKFSNISYRERETFSYFLSWMSMYNMSRVLGDIWAHLSKNYHGKWNFLTHLVHTVYFMFHWELVSERQLTMKMIMNLYINTI
jgi:hypothetical protein